MSDKFEARKAPWDSIGWSNTHLDGIDDRDQHHVGSIFSEQYGDLVVLRLGSDDDDEPHTTVFLTTDQAHDLAAMLRMAAR